MTERLYSTTFDKLALALANDYESIFVVDSHDDSYVEYTAEGAEKQLVLRSKGDDFFVDVEKNVKEQIFPEDQEIIINKFRKERVLDALENGKSFSVKYRLIVDGRPQYHLLKTIKGNDDNIIIGVQNEDFETAVKALYDIFVMTKL